MIEKLLSFFERRKILFRVDLRDYLNGNLKANKAYYTHYNSWKPFREHNFEKMCHIIEYFLDIYFLLYFIQEQLEFSEISD